jgi:hypothetical protein
METTRDPIGFWFSALGALVLGVTLGAAAAQAQPARPSTAAVKPLTEAERKTVEELQAVQKQFDTDAARLMAASPNGRRRVAEAIARQFSVPEPSVNALRARRMGYGELTIALALSQQLLRRDRSLSPQQAIDRIVAARTSGQWGPVARELNLRLADVITDVKKAGKQLAKLDAATTARAEKYDKMATAQKPVKPEKVEKNAPR